ncbi:MAG: penicillin-binding protein 2 [Candidatus Peregrinibacteria bacterium]|nr:penicillin-binding protein 2 [Candidatus Peregrinibacteria bacterium]
MYQKPSKRNPINKITIFIIFSSVTMTILVLRLFQLQIFDHEFYQNLATQEQSGSLDLPAQRGEILIKDKSSKEEFALATNTTLNLIFADPTLIKDPQYITEKLIPLLYKVEDERATDNERIEKLSRKLPANTTEEEKEKLLKPLTDEELSKQYKDAFLTKISEKRRSQILLGEDFEQENLDKLLAIGASGIEIKDKSVYAYPPQIGNPEAVATQIAQYVEIPAKRLAKLLKGENRYVILKRRLSPDISDTIKKMFKEDKDKLLSGLGMQEESFRYYPEGNLAASLLGYVNYENQGEYGIESTFDTELSGVAGKFNSKKDSMGRQITVGDSVLQPAIDGDTILLTIDRSIQSKTERLLEEGVKEYDAESAQAIVMDPKTGKIMAMATYPTFDPNNYGQVFKRKEIQFTAQDMQNLTPTKTAGIYYYYTKKTELDRYVVFEEKDPEGNVHYYKYENLIGPEVYHNKIVSWPYEPGSSFKPIVMSMALDDGDVTPNTTFNDIGPIKVDYNKYTGEYDFEIKNSTGYYGLVNMSVVLEKSLNTGMTFVSKKIGPALFYNYLKKFGFLDRTDIEMDSEAVGKIEYFEGWTESELATHAFGQGLTVTMIQMAQAYCALANGGTVMKPYLVEEIRHPDGTKTTFEPQEITKVISEDTSSKIITMLVNSTERGFATKGQVPNHFVSGKTGTSQTYKGGRALFGKGTTIGTFAGFGPIEDPKFVIIVKYDYAKQSEWGSDTAGPTFSKLAEFIFDYLNIPPDK